MRNNTGIPARYFPLLGSTARPGPAATPDISISTDTSRLCTGTTRLHIRHLGRSRSPESARQHLAQPLACLDRAAALGPPRRRSGTPR